MTTVINPTLVLTNIRDEDLYSLSLAFSNRLPWLDTILAELQTGRDNAGLPDKIEEFHKEIVKLQEENAVLSETLTDIRNLLKKVEVIY